MKYKLTCFIVLACLTTRGFAQEIDVTNVTRVTLLNPGLSYETRIGKLQTLYLQAFMNTSSYSDYSNSMGFDYEFYFDPAVTAQYRYYYNGDKRLQKNKRTEMNSMNYVAVIGETVFSKMPMNSSYLEETSRRAVSRLGVAWGLQRNFEKRFSLDLNLGLGYLFANGTTYDMTGAKVKKSASQATMVGQLNIGFWLNKRKS
jgi:hypothetical protein